MSTHFSIEKSKYLCIFYIYIYNQAARILQWNHWQLDCLYNSLFRLTTKKHQCPASLAIVMGNHQSLVDSPHKGPVMQKMVPWHHYGNKHVKIFSIELAYQKSPCLPQPLILFRQCHIYPVYGCQCQIVGLVSAKFPWWHQFVLTQSNESRWLLPYIKMQFYHYRKFHCEEKIISWWSCLQNRISCTVEMASLHWHRIQILSNSHYYNICYQNSQHYSDVTWASWQLNLMKTRLFIQQLVQTISRLKALLTLSEGKPWVNCRLSLPTTDRWYRKHPW